MTFRRTLEMSISGEEFLRLLRAVVDAFDPDGETIRWLDRGRSWTIRLVPLPARSAGSVKVPRHRVEIALDDCTAAEGEAFMQRFHRAFLRGGG